MAAQVFIPFSVGGGIRSVADATELRLAGAEKINVNSAAVERPGTHRRVRGRHRRPEHRAVHGHPRGAGERRRPSGYEIVINGGRTPTGQRRAGVGLEGERLGAGELVVNSIDADGTREGYEITLTAHARRGGVASPSSPPAVRASPSISTTC